ncbi:MAG: BolA family transcriptional regulator [Rhodospirillales bacterium]|nr:BolA family transcriptional regulator [Rhodospirillales bacterium]
MTIASILRAKLQAAFEPSLLTIVDESHKHVGHAGARPEGETHFRVEIVSQQFGGKSRVDRHRMVTAVIAEELAGPVHAFSLKALTPAEIDAR